MRRVLVANRGEVAIRVIRAVHDLGLEAVAVHSSADANQPHVRLADQAVEIGPPPSAKSYLNVEAILDAARATGAEAIHPGYGFLAENADFAAAVEAAGLRFVGPEAGHIALMGDKARARETARDQGVPTIPGSGGAVRDADHAAEVAADVGYPVAIKAAGGGGGRGIRIVHDPSELGAGFRMASREAASAFQDPRVYLEHFIEAARHIEVQVLGDGVDTLHFGERECSLQRRRQKLIEETPAVTLPERTRAQLHRAALALSHEIGYRSAGTVEFLYDDVTGEFFFIEMNTRIQVEHPITEMVTGVDLVVEQLRVAAGERLSLRQEDIVPRGAAIELRLNAEDPDQDFTPSPGPLGHVELPAGPWVRVDSWMDSDGEVPPFYDSLLGKVITWGPDRETAIARARRALRDLRVDGVKTTKPLLATLLDEPWFAAGDFHTRTLEAWLEQRTEGVRGA
jgi:acetyl-CoA carboxylase biotin carboxylase subunit